MVPEAELEQTDEGLVAKSDGWFVLNARDARWYHAEGRSAFSDLEGDVDFTQLGVNISVLGPGESMSMYHWEADQEAFLVLSGEAVLIVEGHERRLRAWDFVHSPPGTKHVIIGAGDGPCVVVAVGAREHDGQPGSLGFPADEVARRHGASVEADTMDGGAAYSSVPGREPIEYRDGWLPD
jgi:uncharacterized cupin superfamily protein